MSEIIQSTWFSNATIVGCVGIVIVRTEQQKLRAYLGEGFGVEQKEDEERIAEYGSRFPLKLAAELMGVTYEAEEEDTD